MKNFKELITGQSYQPVLHIAPKDARFLGGATGPWNDRDFDTTRGATTEDNLCCESGT